MWIWIVVAVVAAIGEVITMDLFLAIVAVAAVVAGVVGFVLPLEAQILIFALLSIGGILFVRPALKRGLGIDPESMARPSQTQSHLVGRRAVVTHEVDAGEGQVRIGQGEFWTARTLDPETRIPVGARVEVVLVDGLTAVVEPVETPALEEKKG
jgi:membrane protein implicated in regulation of membrane protease activity